MKENVMANFLSWIRFVVYDGDLDELYVSMTDAYDKAKAEAQADGKKFKGSIKDFVKPVSLHNEVRAWTKIF
jgi:hypothetical protein